MLSVEKITYYLNHFKDLQLADLQLLFDLARSKQLKAGHIYIDCGSPSKRLAYIKKGLIRAYQLNEKGEDITVLLRWEDQFFSNMDTVFWQRPSRFVYEALEDTELLETDYDQFMSFIDAHPRFAAAKTFFLQNMLAESFERVERFILMSPEQRYLHLLAEKNNLAQRVPSKYLATLLGITPVSLSRIKRRITQKH